MQSITLCHPAIKYLSKTSAKLAASINLTSEGLLHAKKNSSKILSNVNNGSLLKKQGSHFVLSLWLHKLLVGNRASIPATFGFMKNMRLLSARGR